MSNDKKTTGKAPRPVVLPDGTVFNPVGIRVTSAPLPIKPLGANATVRKKPAPTTHKPAVPVDWSFWPASRRVKQDEAIALSLDLDPHSLYSNIDGHINPECCPDNATAILFQKRLNLLAASNSRTNIPLSEFAAWSVSISLSPIPPGLEAIASAAKSKETRARAVAKVADAMMARNKPIERVYILQPTAPHAPPAPNATKSDGNVTPAEVSPGNTADTGPVSNTDIPGKLPRISIGKLAIEAAWLIENANGKPALAEDVMRQLQAWADDGSKPEVLQKTLKAKRSVEWRTKEGKAKEYGVEACGKALAAWEKTRA